MKLETALAHLAPVKVCCATRWNSGWMHELREARVDLVILNEAVAPIDCAAPFDWFQADGQTVCFRRGHQLGQALRQLFIRRVNFVGAAPSLGMCTLDAIEALKQADVCLHDTLFDPTILEQLRPDALAVNVGKRCGKHAVKQPQINQLLLDYTRAGKRVVRLKAGDPGIYGRLCEETTVLIEHALPFHVQPAVSSLSVATTGTGLLLTRRGTQRGFTVMTPRRAGGELGDINPSARSLPVILFMATHVIRESFRSLCDNGTAPGTPAAIIYDAGTPHETIVEGTVETLPDIVDNLPRRTGLVYVGQGAREARWPAFGPLANKRIKADSSTPSQLRLRMLDLGATPVMENHDTLVTSMDDLEMLALESVASHTRQAALV